MKFFAYGLNMLAAKMISVITFAKLYGVGELTGYRLVFNKKSHKDESGYATLVSTGNPKDKVYGVIYEFSDSHKSTLDIVEGTHYGYEEESLTVLCDGSKVTTSVYLAKKPEYLQSGLKPFNWYKAMILKGARQHALPADYIAAIEAVPELIDSDANRVRVHEEFL